MVGIRAWNVTEIIWILDKWRDRCKIQSLMDQFTAQFPNSSRSSNHKTLRTGIQYVWDKYNKDPSFNHYFLDDEVWFIMVNSHASNKNVIREVLRLFKEAFPGHDWNTYVDELLAIEATIASYQREPPYSVQWQEDEVQFVLSKTLTIKNWDNLLAAFQAWRQRKEVTVNSLRYLVESHQLSKRNETEDSEDDLLDVTIHHPNELPDIARKSIKRKREGGVEQPQNKRLTLPQQQSSFMRQENQVGPLPSNMSRSLDRTFRCGNLGSPGLHHPRVSFCDACTKTGFNLPETGLQQQDLTGEDSQYVNDLTNSSGLNYKALAMDVSQHDPAIPPPPQAPDPRHPFPNVTPQELMCYGWNHPYVVTSLQNPPVVDEQFPWHCCAGMFWCTATCPNSVPPWSPRSPWYRNNFQFSNFHTGPVTDNADPSMLTNCRGPQAMSGGNSCREPSVRNGGEGYPGVEDPHAQVEAIDMLGEEQQQVCQTAVDASIWQSGLPSCESWLASISTIPDDFFTEPIVETSQQFYPDKHSMDGLSESHSPEGMLAPASMPLGNRRGALETEGNQLSVRERDIPSEQPTFDSNGRLSYPFETEAYQDLIFPRVQARQIQNVCLPNGASREQKPEPVEAENFSTHSMLESSRDFLGPETMPEASVTNDDEFREAALAIEPGEFEDFFYFGHFDPTNLSDSPKLEPRVHEGAFGMIELGDSQLLRRDDPKNSEQPDLSAIGTFEEAGGPSVTSQVNLTNTARLPLSPGKKNAYPPQCTSDTGRDHAIGESKLKDGEDAQASQPCEISRLSSSGLGEWMDSVPKWLPVSGNNLTVDGTADISTETGAVREKYVPPN